MKSNNYLYIDFGNIFTKVVAIDTEKEEVLGYSQAFSTISTDISEGLEKAMNDLQVKTGDIKYAEKIACSSIDVGLRIVTIGLVSHLSADASEKVALTAGVNVLKAYSGSISTEDIEEIQSLDVDMILLCGGTDGGNKDNVINNSHKLIALDKNISIVYAGNKDAAFECRKILEKDFLDVRITENVMPQHGILNIEPARKTIKEVYAEKILKSDSFAKIQRKIYGVTMPTSYAILNAATLLSKGINDINGIGELMLIDCGGFSTNIYSIASGSSTDKEVIDDGVSEPYEKRTYEDFGTRHNIENIIEEIGIDELKKEFKKISKSVKGFAENLEKIKSDSSFLPLNEEQLNIDRVISKNIIKKGVNNHVGTIIKDGNTFAKVGKDLSNVKAVVGIGGAIIHSNNPKNILEGVVYSDKQSNKLKPKEPEFYIYNQNIAYALGMLGESDSEKATRMMKKYLSKI